MVRAVDVVILIPVFDDWVAAAGVVELLDRALVDTGRRASVLLVNDGSHERPARLDVGSLGAVDAIEILSLRRNLGHQRAIGVGLAWLERNRPCDAVVVMDGDGEDDPVDVPRLLEQWERVGGTHVVFAERARRSENAIFRVSYVAFKLVHRILTGRGVRVGNFSVVPSSRLGALVSIPDLWNHYAASVFVSRLPLSSIATARAKRIAGRSAMNYAALVMHGLSAIAVFSETVSVRVLLATFACSALAVAGVVGVVALRLFTELAIPGWATFTSGILLMLFLQSIMFSILFSFSVLANRKAASVILARDYELFVDTVYRPAVGSASGADRASM